MNVDRNKTQGMKISLRIALFAWQITFMTIVVLVLFIIPQQKEHSFKIFIQKPTAWRYPCAMWLPGPL